METTVGNIKATELRSIKYQRAKAYIEISKVHRQPKVNCKETVGEDSKHPVLFAMLKEWRSYKAKDIGQPSFVVLHQKTLIQIIETLPSDLKQLRSVKGIGKQKIKAFGQEILNLIEQYCRENSIERGLLKDKRNKDNISTEHVTQEQPNTRTISFEMFRKGMTVPKIAAARGLTIGTIEGHLAKYVSNGQIEISELPDKEKLRVILSAFAKHGSTQLTFVKEQLGDDFSYGDLRFAREYLSFFGKGESGKGESGKGE